MLDDAKVPAVTVFRYSWWKTSDGKREFVVVEIIYDTNLKDPDFFKIKEREKPIPYQVTAKDWIGNILTGRIVQVI